jgi:hypothetical protein
MKIVAYLPREYRAWLDLIDEVNANGICYEEGAYLDSIEFDIPPEWTLRDAAGWLAGLRRDTGAKFDVTFS